MCAPCASLMSLEVRRGYQIPETGVKNSCKLPYGCWALNLGPLKEQPVFLTTEPSCPKFYNNKFKFYCFICLMGI